MCVQNKLLEPRESHRSELCSFGAGPVMIMMFNLLLLGKWPQLSARFLLSDQLPNFSRSISSFGEQRELSAVFENELHPFLGVEKIIKGPKFQQDRVK